MPNKIKKLFNKFWNYINPFWLWIKRNFINFLYLVFGALSVASFVALVLVMLDDNTICKLLGTANKKETIQFIGFGISGLIGFIAIISLTRRANALDEANQLVEKGHVQERFKVAIEHLGNLNSATIRIASFYELYHLARDNKDLRQNILDVLCAYLRNATKNEDYKNGVGKENPTEEVQNLLNVLFKKDGMIDNFNFRFPHLPKIFNLKFANLKEVYLVGADLSHANLEFVELSHAHLEMANLEHANMKNVDLSRAHLENAKMFHVNLISASMYSANLAAADLSFANLKNANMGSANLMSAELYNAHLEEANLKTANLSNAYLIGTNLQNADLGGADLYGAEISDDTKMPDGWEEVVRRMLDGTVNEVR